MIGRLRGLLAHRDGDGTCLVEAGGVGYEVVVPVGGASRLPPEGETVTLWVHTLVREDAFTLYGFPQRAERDLFRLLIGISNVGPKLAVALLGHLGREGLAAAVAREDRKALQGVPGVGRKTAERLLVELRDKVGAPLGAEGASAATAVAPSAAPLPAGPLQQVVAALERLGFRPPEARAAAEAATERLQGSEDVQALLREALRSLA